MTSIEQLQICGIRSFDPNPARRQTVTFHKPLTVILGKNGAGKTTIIEALLNACTGAMPPGSGMEKSAFVYDPKVLGESEVKAQIRLIFTGKGGKMMQVIRSFRATRSSNKVSFATLDNTVAFQDTATGKVVSNTYRATDVDRVVPEMLGVSPAVLEHVIFCHQEDCNWPLAPPKDVKRIFDDIFAATRYVSALERLRENSKKLKQQQKAHETSLMVLREHKDQAKQLEQEIARKEGAVSEIRARNDATEPERRELRQAAAALDAVEQELESLSKAATLTQGRMDEKREALARTRITPSPRGLDELLRDKAALDARLQESSNAVTTTTTALTGAEASARDAETRLQEARAALQLRAQAQRQYDDCKAELQGLLAGLAEIRVGGVTVPGMETSHNGGDSADVAEAAWTESWLSETLPARLQTAVQRARDGLQAALRESGEGVRAIETQQHTLQRGGEADAKEREMLTTRADELRRRLAELDTELAGLGGEGCRARLQRAQTALTQLEERANAARAVRQRGAAHEQRVQILHEVDAQNRLVARLRRQLARQRQRAHGQTELQLLRGQLTERQDTIRAVLRDEVLPRLESLALPGLDELRAPTLTVTAVLAKVSAVRRGQEEALARSAELVTRLERTGAVLEQRRASLMEELTRQTAVVRRLQAECDAVVPRIAAPQDAARGEADNADDRCDEHMATVYEAAVGAAREAAATATQKLHALETMASCYDDFVATARRTRRCALCERPFDDEATLDHFVSATHRADPASIDAARQTATALREELARLEALQPTVERLRQLRVAMPQQESAVVALTTELQRCEEQRTTQAAQKVALEQAVQGLAAVCQRLYGAQSVEAEADGLRAHLARLERQLAESSTSDEGREDIDGQNNGAEAQTGGDGDGAGRTFEELSEAYEQATTALHTLNLQLSELERVHESEDAASEARALEAALQTQRNEAHELEFAVRRLDELQAARTQAEAELQLHHKRLQELAARRGAQEATLAELAAELQQKREAHAVLEGQLHAQMALLEGRQHQVTALLPRLREQLSACRQGGQSPDVLAARVRELQGVCARYNDEVTTLRAALRDARAAVESQQAERTTLERVVSVAELHDALRQDAARLQDIQRRLEELKRSQVSEVASVLGAEAHKEPLPRLRERIRVALSELEKARAQREGNAEAMLQDIGNLKAQLAKDKYRNIEERYRWVFLELQTTEIAVKDVDKYYGALEKAVQSYHQEKIAQINQIIAELWRQTYRGSDIDTVEICSETESTTTTAARRSYNYRVVMRRGNSVIDMRGRCSAGQRVLASVLIRLALSEAFCCDCGILALDEPTTNLDEDNARSLAEALRMLIETRRTLKHFQLIVITHDEQFVRALGGQSLDRFYYVHKDREGAYSIIEERTFDQLFA